MYPIARLADMYPPLADLAEACQIFYAFSGKRLTIDKSFENRCVWVARKLRRQRRQNLLFLV